MHIGNHDSSKCKVLHYGGEKRFYHFLESVAKPDSEYIAWYTPDLKGKEPDFILFNDEEGLTTNEKLGQEVFT